LGPGEEDEKNLPLHDASLFNQLFFNSGCPPIVTDKKIIENVIFNNFQFWVPCNETTTTRRN
jgi:hypothetical protein